MDSPFGLCNAQDVMLRRKLEQEVELQQAIELQGRRMMGLQLMESKNQHKNNHFLPGFRASRIPIPSPRRAQLSTNENFNHSSEGSDRENFEDSDSTQEAAKSPPLAIDHKLFLEKIESLSSKQLGSINNGSNFLESLEHILPDNLVASPTKLAAEHEALFSIEPGSSTGDGMTIPLSDSNNMVSINSCYLQMPSHLNAGVCC